MLGHLAHPVTTPVWGHDKCSFTPALRTLSGQRTHIHTAMWAPNTRRNSGMDVIFLERLASLGFGLQRKLQLRVAKISFNPQNFKPTEHLASCQRHISAAGLIKFTIIQLYTSKFYNKQSRDTVSYLNHTYSTSL